MDSGACAEKPDPANYLYPLKALSSTVAPQVLPATIRIEIPRSKGVVVVSWPAENAAACFAFLPDLAAMIRIDTIWLATEPMDMRAGTETALARLVVGSQNR
ncbi:hypothetical protein [Pseudomonas sp. RA_15y_Pfl2_54]|uniref:hypothetical protein n=1 Tax=Pseudomonas sp. RA_15y_Pfl2_54 TaxID=3088704 RepID=UPI0030DB81F6